MRLCSRKNSNIFLTLMVAFLGVQETDMKNIALQSVNFSKLNIAMQFKSPPE